MLSADRADCAGLKNDEHNYVTLFLPPPYKKGKWGLGGEKERERERRKEALLAASG